MDEPLEMNFVEQMRDALQKQLSGFELAQKKAKIVADGGLKKWVELKDRLKNHIEKINERLPEANFRRLKLYFSVARHHEPDLTLLS